MYETVLLPTDGSQAMETVVEHARDVAARRGAEVQLLYVVDDRAFLTLDDDRVPEVSDHLQEEGERATQTAAAEFEADDLDVTTEIRRGDPADEILASADECGADLIVMGTHGADPTRNLLGSVSQKVVTLSPIPVLTVNVAEATDQRPAFDVAVDSSSD